MRDSKRGIDFIREYLLFENQVVVEKCIEVLSYIVRVMTRAEVD